MHIKPDFSITISAPQPPPPKLQTAFTLYSYLVYDRKYSVDRTIYTITSHVQNSY